MPTVQTNTVPPTCQPMDTSKSHRKDLGMNKTPLAANSFCCAILKNPKDPNARIVKWSSSFGKDVMVTLPTKDAKDFVQVSVARFFKKLKEAEK